MKKMNIPLINPLLVLIDNVRDFIYIKYQVNYISNDYNKMHYSSKVDDYSYITCN